MSNSSTNVSGSSSLTSYKVLSFDVFGTLLDWESGFYPFFKPIVQQLPEGHPCAIPFPTQASDAGGLAPQHPLFVAFNAHEARIMAELPTIPYEKALGFAYRDLATQLGVTVSDTDVEAAATSQASWPAFHDTVDAMLRLSKYYKLVALSNVSQSAIKPVLEGAFKDFKFDAVYIAEEIGSYKPAMDNFEFLLDGVRKEFGAEREQLLHVAHGVTSDQLPAEGMDIDHVWVERKVNEWGTNRKEGMKRLRIVSDMKQLADMAEAAFGGRTNGV